MFNKQLSQLCLSINLLSLEIITLSLSYKGGMRQRRNLRSKRSVKVRLITENVNGHKSAIDATNIMNLSIHGTICCAVVTERPIIIIQYLTLG